MKNLTYPQTFAESIWLPFTKGSRIGLLIARANSVFDEFTANRANWFSESGYEYSAADMAGHWEMIVEQKKRVEALWLVEQGLFPAYNPARQTLG